jgi:hypothetical protein
MITVKQQEKLINKFETLSELELQSVLGELADFIRKNKYEHLIVNLFDDEIEDAAGDRLADETEGLEKEIDNLEDSIRDIKDKVYKAMNELEDAKAAVEEDHPGWTLPELDKAIQILEDI